jgi:hypothetical protein
MRNLDRRWAPVSVAAAALAAAFSVTEALAQAPAAGSLPPGCAEPRQDGGRGGPQADAAGESGATLLFREGWSRAFEQPMTKASICNQQLTLHLYGHADEIRKTAHPTEDYTYTGETTTNWALTLGDPGSYWDVSGAGRIRLTTRNTGFRVTHVVIKTADGKYFASEEGNPESSAWIARDYIFRDLTWRNLLMTDTPTNASNRRQPNPKRVPIVPTSRGTPDLTRVEEIGFSDLTEGGWIPATTRVLSWEVWGKAVARR